MTQRNWRREYERYIASDRWLFRRMNYFRWHEKCCAGCGFKDEGHSTKRRERAEIQLHHKTYERMGAELDDDLVPVCQRCHSLIHEYHRRVGGSLYAATDHVLKRLQDRLSEPSALAEVLPDVRVGRRPLLIDKFSNRAAHDRATLSERGLRS